MKRVILAAMLMATVTTSLAQEAGKEERLNYLDISVGYSLALPPFSNAKTDAVFLKPRSGGSMSFGLTRRIGDQWGVQIEVLTAAFKVNGSDLKSAAGNGVTLSQVDIAPYRSTFFGAGAVSFLPVGRFTLDFKGSAGVNVSEFAAQEYVSTANQPSGVPVSYTVSAKRSVTPGLLVGSRLRYPIGESVDLGVKVEYGISYANFNNVQRLTNNVNPEKTVVAPLPSISRTISYLNAGFTLGLRF